ncbi:MAG: DUF962 domain-containing protein [Deltaproteobacteria bacterium]|nr:DUF962 domain-containing protein [Deltaproteobacteria bacterium]
MSKKRIPTFAAFWPFYLSQHAVPLCRHLHFVGTVAILSNAVYAAVTMQPLFLLLTPLLGYGPAWFAHFIIEKNRPATFTYPVWSLLGDFKMFGGMLTGKYWTGTPVAPMTEEAAADAASPVAAE